MGNNVDTEPEREAGNNVKDEGQKALPIQHDVPTNHESDQHATISQSSSKSLSDNEAKDDNSDTNCSIYENAEMGDIDKDILQNNSTIALQLNIQAEMDKNIGKSNTQENTGPVQVTSILKEIKAIIIELPKCKSNDEAFDVVLSKLKQKKSKTLVKAREPIATREKKNSYS